MNIPTESRIFANRYSREARKLEALHAGRLSPGTTNWYDAVEALMHRLETSDGPIKAARIVKQATTCLKSSPRDEVMHFLVTNAGTSKRSADLAFATIGADHHPLTKEEEGIGIMLHALSARRNGVVTGCSGLDLAFVSKHAMSRLHERGHRFSKHATSVFAYIGALGYLTRYSPKHIKGGLCLLFDETLIVGMLRHNSRKMKSVGPDSKHKDLVVDATFFDVRTVLTTDMGIDHLMVEQGKAASAVVGAWFKERAKVTEEDWEEKLADGIPYLPGRYDDYLSRAYALATKEKEQTE